MSEVKDIVAVNITRETRYPTKAGFGSGAIISEFTPGKLNNSMLGGGRYQLYTGLTAMSEDGWASTDKEYRAAMAYFSQNPNPGTFMVGRKDATDADWLEALAAIQSVYTNWYAFTIVSSSAADIKAVASWAETMVKIFGYTSAEEAIIGIQVALTAGFFTSGALGDLENFQDVTDGEFMVAKDGAAAVEVDGINMSAAATAGLWVTGTVTGKMAAFQVVSDGEFDVTLDGGSAVPVAAIDLSSANSFAAIAALLQTAVQAETGLETVTVGYDSGSGRFVFTSDTTGATSSVLVEVAGSPSGTDLTLPTYFDGGDETTGTAASLPADMDAVATALEAAITASGVTGITVAYSDSRMVFTSDTSGNSSEVVLFSVPSGPGTDLMGSLYLNGGESTLGTAQGNEPGVDDLATELKALGYDHTVLIYNALAQNKNGVAAAEVQFSFMAWIGEALPFDPASQTWAFKSLSGITPSTIGTGQEIFAKGNNANIYVVTGGVPITLDGKVVGGEYIDIIRGTHWLESEMQNAVFATLLNNRKVPFTDQGIALVENAMRGVLAQAEVDLLNTEDTILTIPKRVDTDPADRAARFLDGVSFNSTYQGAIQKVAIQGTLSV